MKALIGKIVYKETRTILKLDKVSQEIISEYKTVTEASNETKIDIRDILNVLNHKQNTAGGFIWKYN